MVYYKVSLNPPCGIINPYANTFFINISVYILRPSKKMRDLSESLIDWDDVQCIQKYGSLNFA